MSNRNKNQIAVIGHLVRDRIVGFSGNKVEALGGIAYSLAALTVAAGKQCGIIPVCSIGYDLVPVVRQVFGQFPAIDLSHIRQIDRKNKIHELIYKSGNYREELNYGELPKITPSLFNGPGRIDAALVSYIGGDEFQPRNIRWLKGHFMPLIYLDYHSLALGRTVLDKKRRIAKRYFRHNPHWREYVCEADIVQMNFLELKSIFPETENEVDSIITSVKAIKSTGPGIVIITREEKDLIVIAGLKRKPDIYILPVRPIAKVVDPTGCGDSFAAGFLSSYIDYKDVLKACETGLDLAGRKAGFSGLDGFLWPANEE